MLELIRYRQGKFPLIRIGALFYHISFFDLALNFIGGIGLRYHYKFRKLVDCRLIQRMYDLDAQISTAVRLASLVSNRLKIFL